MRVSVSAPCERSFCSANTQTISSSVDLTVFSPLTLSGGPDFIVPTNARFQLPVAFSHKRELQYRLFSVAAAAASAASQPVRSTVAPDGTVSAASEREDAALVVVHIVDGSVLQRAVATIHVEQPRHLSLQPEPACHHLTLGSHCIVRVVLQDVAGRPLVYTDGIDIKVRGEGRERNQMIFLIAVTANK